MYLRNKIGYGILLSNIEINYNVDKCVLIINEMIYPMQYN